MDRSELMTELKQVIVDELELRKVKPEDITDDGLLFGPDGIGLDSLDGLQLVQILELRYDVELAADEEAAKANLKSVATIADFLLDALANR